MSISAYLPLSVLLGFGLAPYAFGQQVPAGAPVAAKAVCADLSEKESKLQSECSQADKTKVKIIDGERESDDSRHALAGPAAPVFDPSKEERSRHQRQDPSASDTASGAQQTAPGDPQELAKQLANPIASLISVPFQSNFDFGMGPDKRGVRYTMNFQPVIPFALNKDWNVISRTILPIIAQDNVVGTSSQFGLGDTIQSFFFSPNKTDPVIWGVGPQFLIPTATDEFLGSQKFGIGPTFVILKQKKGWTYGALVNHTWSVFGKDSRADVSSTFLQPFLAYTTKNAWTFTFNTESAYDWTGKTWNVPIHFQTAKLIRMGKQPVSVGVALRCWAESGPGGPQGCGFRMVFVPLFPAK